jgi:hypothetical protein
LTQLQWSRQNHRWGCWIPSPNTTSRMLLKMAEALGAVHTFRRGLLRGWWWPVGRLNTVFRVLKSFITVWSKLGLYQMQENKVFTLSQYLFWSHNNMFLLYSCVGVIRSGLIDERFWI